MRTVLVVDDDAAIAGMVREALEMDGYRVVRAVDGESVRVALVEQPRVVLLDINMPGMDGPEVARRLRADPATAHIPIVVMSSQVTRDGVPPEMPHDDRLPKPFALDALFATVARWAA
ncbi:MAG: response regulator, partial [Chloroflexi bacterium]|nr:response regulator [Chloroflexota bacterium]